MLEGSLKKDYIQLIKRHDESHFANIKYGYFILFISFIYTIFIIFLRKIINIPTSESKYRKSWRYLHSLNPLVHLTILCIP